MEWSWIFGAILFIMICGISGKVDKIERKIDNLETQDDSNKKNKTVIQDDILEDYIGKKIHLEIENEDINNFYLFDVFNPTEGEIIEYDNVWLAFKYYSKEHKKEVIQYFRRRDIKSINEIK